MASASVKNGDGYTRIDLALTGIFTCGFLLYIYALWMEFQTGAASYIMAATAGSIVSIAATFIATMRQKKIIIIIQMDATE